MVLHEEAQPVATTAGSTSNARSKEKFGHSWSRASIPGADVSLAAVPLIGNDGKSSITVSQPWILGSFPVTSSRKCVAQKVRVRTPGLSFDYSGTNANDGLFEIPFHPGEIIRVYAAPARRPKDFSR